MLRPFIGVAPCFVFMAPPRLLNALAMPPGVGFVCREGTPSAHLIDPDKNSGVLYKTNRGYPIIHGAEHTPPIGPYSPPFSTLLPPGGFCVYRGVPQMPCILVDPDKGNLDPTDTKRTCSAHLSNKWMPEMESLGDLRFRKPFLTCSFALEHRTYAITSNFAVREY